MLTRRSWLTVTSLLALEQVLAPGAFVSEAWSKEDAPGSDVPLAPKLLLVPLGKDLTFPDIDYVKQCLEAFYDFRIDTFERTELPALAYYGPRKRYRAEKLLTFLNQLAPSGYSRVLGLTATDISTTKGQVFDWGVLGLATIDGKVGVLSSHRCARGTTTRHAQLVRFAKVAVHELGHTLGLEHCPVRGCLMEDAKGSVLTTDIEYDLCEKCRRALAASGRAARENPVIPWPKPTG